MKYRKVPWLKRMRIRAGACLVSMVEVFFLPDILLINSEADVREEMPRAPGIAGSSRLARGMCRAPAFIVVFTHSKG
jgi:hypothetical protein